MKILVTGADGMLGSELVPYFESKQYTVYPTDLPTLDVRDSFQVNSAPKPDIVIHLAALTDLEYCEQHPTEAAHTNIIGTSNVAAFARWLDIPIVYISTAGVFDGQSPSPYTEQDIPNPINVYGRTKLQGERQAVWITPKCYIVRAGWMLGGGPYKDHKFTSLIVDQLREGKTDIFAVNDKFGAPTYALDFAKNLLSLIETGEYGLYHMANTGEATRFAVAHHIVDALVPPNRVQVHPVPSTYFKHQYSTPRPPNECLTNDNLNKIGLNMMRPWHVALNDYLGRYNWELANG